MTFSENQFGKLSEHGFTLAEKLSAVVSIDTVLFESFPVLRSFLTVQEHFEQATAQEIDEFAQHPAFHLEDRALFESQMDERCRKLIRGIKKSNVLGKHAAPEIVEKAATVGLALTQRDGSIVLPSVKRELKMILSFLEESVYKGIFSDETFMTNSKRPVT